jgi:ribosome maturation factor RimP
VVSRNLDGEFISTKLDPKVKRLQLAEQVLRELLDDYQGTHLDLDSIDIVDLPDESILIAGLQASRHIMPFEVARFEKAIQERLEDRKVRLLIRSSDVTDVSSKGRVLYGRAHFGKSSGQEVEIQEKLEREVQTHIERFPNTFAPNVDAEKRDGMWHVLAEVVGPIILTPAQIRLVEKGVSSTSGNEIRLRVWCRTELVVDNAQFMSEEGFSKKEIEKREGKGRLHREK